ncbi:hypothetical protein SDC9_90158 [bioreactor metagenome]|uniref:Uncharacterized protein n=1 Tax=bioreactor metagenome TaxID=1076179 RepID=A0A644ZXX0_9ZZZZ
MGDLQLVVEASARLHHVIDRLVAAERGLDRMLSRYVRAHAHIRQELQTFEKIRRIVQRPGRHQPAGPPAAGPVGLGKP